jgi:hypothetical protein
MEIEYITVSSQLSTKEFPGNKWFSFANRVHLDLRCGTYEVGLAELFLTAGSLGLHGNGNLVLLESNIVRAQRYGDVERPLLRMIPVSRLNYCVIADVQYRPVAADLFETIELWCTTDSSDSTIDAKTAVANVYAVLALKRTH